MKKNIGIILFLLMFSISGLASAEENEELKLSENENLYLINDVGMEEDEVKELPVDVAKQLVKDEAVVIDSGSEIFNFFEDNMIRNDLIMPMSAISSSTMKLAGVAYKVTSDRKNEDKFYIYGNFTWLKTPSFVLVDKMTFGFPSSLGFYLPTSGGKVTQHQHRYLHDIQGNGKWHSYPLSTTPNDWEANAGVSGEFDLRAGNTLSKHKGFMGQYVYVPKSKNGKINIKIEYGHKRITGVPSVSVYPFGLGIASSNTVDTASYALTLSY